MYLRGSNLLALLTLASLEFFMYIIKHALCNMWPHLRSLQTSITGDVDDEGIDNNPASSSKPDISDSDVIHIGQGLSSPKFNDETFLTNLAKGPNKSSVNKLKL